MTDTEHDAPSLPNFPPVRPTEDIPAWTPPYEIDSPPPRTRRAKRTRAKAPEPEPEKKAPPSPEDIGKLQVACMVGFQSGFRMIAASRGEHWNMPQDEAKALGDVWGEALAPYVGNLSGYMMLGIAALRTFDAFSSRFAIDKDKLRNAQATDAVVVRTEVPSANAD